MVARRLLVWRIEYYDPLFGMAVMLIAAPTWQEARDKLATISNVTGIVYPIMGINMVSPYPRQSPYVKIFSTLKHFIRSKIG